MFDKVPKFDKITLHQIKKNNFFLYFSIGPKGNDGKKGDRGMKGDQGPMGLPGPMGFRGSDF